MQQNTPRLPSLVHAWHVLRLMICCTIWLIGVAASGSALAQTVRNEPIRPLPSVDSLKLDPRKVALGERLFFDPRLSKDNTVMCASCHQESKGGADGLKTAIGIRQQAGPINAPTVLNSGLNFRQFWDGRADSLESQIDGVVHNPKEFDMNWPAIEAKLSTDPQFSAEMQAVYADGIKAKNMKDAIATYERTLLTPSRFDRWLKGDDKAITADELKGYQLFKNYGCVACHQGVNVGGNMYQKFGALNDYFAKRGNITEADLGRYNVTKRESDKHLFKVPTLRNIALTAPYFHDASAQTLEQAVDVMFRHQLGRPASGDDKKYIIQFLRTLTGEKFEGK